MKQKIIACLIFLFILAIPLLSSASETNGVIDTTYKYAWSENIDWINFGCDHCGIAITDSGIIGYAWSKNYGWINLNPSTSGISNNGEGTLSGQAWGENTGWINFSGVTIDSDGYFSGYATGDITGQISFNCSNTSSCGSSDFKVRTDWRPASARNSNNNEEENTGGGSGYISLPSTGSGAGDIYISINETKKGYIIDTSGRNFLVHINSQIDFITEGNTNQHSAKIIDLDMLTGKIKVKLQSEPITIKLDIGETKQVDLDNNGINDFEVKYNELINNRIDLTFTKPTEFSDIITDGDLIRNPSAKGMSQFDIYIVKTINSKKFKRLILSPHVFESYGHLKWENIKLVDQDTINFYTISNLIRCFDPENNINDPKVYKLTPNNDTGTKEHLNTTASEFETIYDWDAVYNINIADRDAYLLG